MTHAGAAVHGAGALQAIAVAGVEFDGERRRQHLLGLEQRERRPRLAETRAVDAELALFPLGALDAIDEEAVLGDDVEAGIGDGRPEVLLDAAVHHVAGRTLALDSLACLMPRQDLLDRQRPFRRDVLALDEPAFGAAIEVHQPRPRPRQDHRRLRPLRRIVSTGAQRRDGLVRSGDHGRRPRRRTGPRATRRGDPRDWHRRRSPATCPACRGCRARASGVPRSRRRHRRATRARPPRR